MQSTEHNAQSAELLRREIEELRRQLEALRTTGVLAVAPGAPQRPAWNPSKTTIFALTLFAVTLIVVAFFAGYLPMQQRRSVVIAETHREQEALPRVPVVKVERADGKSGLQLPGSIQAINEVPGSSPLSDYRVGAKDRHPGGRHVTDSTSVGVQLLG